MRLLGGFASLALLPVPDRAPTLTGGFPHSSARRHGFARCIAAPAPSSPPSPSSAAPAARFALGRPALAFLWLLTLALLWLLGFRLGGGLELDRGLGIAQQPENSRLDPHEGVARGLLHCAGELGLHGDFGSAPHESQELALRSFLGEFLEVKGPALTL